MIRNIQLNHGGKYVCFIDTDVESLSTSAILVVKGKRKVLGDLLTIVLIDNKNMYMKFC